MRLIDADALMEQFAKLQMVILLDSAEEAEIASMIGNAPTIEPERKRGEWWHYEGMLFCSECGTELYDDITEYLGDDVPKYCPDCGAAMFEHTETTTDCSQTERRRG